MGWNSQLCLLNVSREANYLLPMSGDTMPNRSQHLAVAPAVAGGLLAGGRRSCRRIETARTLR